MEALFRIHGVIPVQVFQLKEKINRKDFGVNFSMVSETGGLLLGEEVKLQAEVQFVKETQAQLVYTYLILIERGCYI